MPRSNKFLAAFVKSAVGLGVIIGLAAAYQGALSLIKLDPYSKLRNAGEGPLGGRGGIHVQEVSLVSYEGDKLVAKCQIDRLRVRQDRQFIDFWGIGKGEYRDQDQTLHFAAAEGNWTATSNRLEVTSGAHVWDKDVNLKASGFSYESDKKLLTCTSTVHGKAYDGDLDAENLMIQVGSRELTAGPVAWKGTATKWVKESGLVQDEKKQRSVWDVKGKTFRIVGDLKVFTEAKGQDDETIVLAKNIEYNSKTDVVVATGDVKYFGLEANMTCDRVVIFRKEKRSIMTGNVRMLVKPEDQQQLAEVEIPPYRPVVPEEIAATRPPAPNRADEEKKLDDQLRSAENRRKYPTVLSADQIEYWYAKGSRHAKVQGSPQARQALPGDRWRMMWAYEAFYDGEAETLKLESEPNKNTVRVKTSIGDDLVGKRLLVSTKEGEDKASGEDFAGKVVSDDEDLRNTGKTKPPPPPSGGLSGPIGSGKLRK